MRWKAFTVALFAVLFAAFAASGVRAADDPAKTAPYEAPSFARPRQIVLSLSERDPARVEEVLSNVVNVQKYYGPDKVQIALVAYGPGVHAILKHDSTVASRIAGLLAIGVEILACDETLKTIHKTASDVLPGVKIVPNGIPEIVERQARGWIYVRP